MVIQSAGAVVSARNGPPAGSVLISADTVMIARNDSTNGLSRIARMNAMIMKIR